MRSLFAFPNPVNEVSARLVAGGVVIMAVLIVMMRLRPEGLWPSDVRQRELHAADETLALDAGADAVPAQPR